MKQSEFLSYLSNELDLYYQIPSTYMQVRFEKKQYINGLMKASRFFGVSLDSLKEVINRESGEQLLVSVQSEANFDIPDLVCKREAEIV